MFCISEEAMQGWDIMSADEIHKGPPHLFAVLGTPQCLCCIQTLAKNKYTVLHQKLKRTLHLSSFQCFQMFPTYFQHCSWLSLSCVILNDLDSVRKCLILAGEARPGSGWRGPLAGEGTDMDGRA
jgi:hypothetical protein